MATDAAKRRLRALRTVERVKEMETQEKAAKAAELRAQVDQFETEKRALLNHIDGKSLNHWIEGAPYLGQFIRSIRAEIERLQFEISKLEPARNRAERDLRDALAEQKTFEILRLRRLAEEKHAAKKREAARMDDIARERWRG